MAKVLIAAAGGRVARRVAAALCTLGEPPRALVRNPTKARDELVDNQGTPLPLEIVVGDLADRDSVQRALVGIEIAFLALGSSLQQVELEQGFIDVAAAVGLPHLVKLSAADARRRIHRTEQHGLFLTPFRSVRAPIAVDSRAKRGFVQWPSWGKNDGPFCYD
jgi:uncharacterized protein YbjT (DUF2867 family)